MKEDFEYVRSQVRIEDVATYLLGQPIRRMYRYPGERTASIKLYLSSQTFFDFGRTVGGDCIRLWAHIRHVDNWTALQSIKDLYGLENVQGNGNITECVRKQEKAREAARKAEIEHKAAWRSEVDFWKQVFTTCDAIIGSLTAFSDEWAYCMNQKQLASYHLDCLCGLCD